MNNPGPKNAAEGSPVTDGNGDRPGADEALRRSEERYRALVEATGQAVWSWSADGTAGDLSRAEKWWEEVTGQTREEQRENPGAWLEVVHPEDREAARAARETALDQGKRYDIEYRVRARSGGCRHIHARGIPIRTAEGSVREWVGTLDDVTDRRRSVVELRESEARFRRLASAGIIGVIRWNLQSSLIVEANDEFLRMTGYDRADLVAGRLNFRSMTPPEWTARNELGVRDLLETGVGGAYEKEYFRKGGGRVAVIIVGVRFEDAANEGMSFVLDITERKRAEDDLRDSAALLRMAADAADAGVWVWDVKEDRVTWQNDWPYALFGIGKSQGPVNAARFLDEFVHPDDAETFKQAVTEAVQTENRLYFPGRMRRPDGDVRWVEFTGRSVPGGDGSRLRMHGTAADVTARKRAEAENQRLLMEVEAERARLAEVFQHAPSFMCVLLGPNHVFERANDGYFALVGRRDIIGKPLRQAVPEVEGQGFLEILDRVYRTGEPYVGTGARITLERGGRLEERMLEFVYQPLRDAEGGVSGILAHGVDLTDRQRAESALAALSAESERQQRMYETALSNTADFVYLFDLQGRFTYMNKALLDLWQKDFSQAVGKNFFELEYPPELADRLQRQIQQVIETRQPLRDETPYTSVAGTRAYEYIFVPVFGKDGTVEAVAGSTRDVTTRKHLEEALREGDRKKDEFLALLAHELRNPLAPLRNGLQVMRLAGGDAEAVNQTRAMMDRQLSHMVRLIDDLLDVSRISRNKMELRLSRIALADVMASAVETVGPLIQTEGHELIVSLPSAPIYLDADLTRLAQVFSNLLTNSAKYTPRGGKIWISAERRDGEVVVAVRDTGIGIPAESLQNIFDMFSQVDRSIERSTGGLGIGLALVKGLVEMHGGTVTAESAGQGLGSTFAVTLPAVTTRLNPAAAIAYDSGQSASGPKRRILVVDDNRDGADSLTMMLQLLGNDVRTAYDGVDAVKQAEAFRPRIILMDVGMPNLSGLDATRQIRDRDWGERIIVIALTGWGQDGDKERTRDAGCDGHLVKPVNLPDLQKLLDDLNDKEN